MDNFYVTLVSIALFSIAFIGGIIVGRYTASTPINDAFSKEQKRLAREQARLDKEETDRLSKESNEHWRDFS